MIKSTDLDRTFTLSFKYFHYPSSTLFNLHLQSDDLIQHDHTGLAFTRGQIIDQEGYITPGKYTPPVTILFEDINPHSLAIQYIGNIDYKVTKAPINLPTNYSRIHVRNTMGMLYPATTARSLRKSIILYYDQHQKTIPTNKIQWIKFTW